MCSNTEYSIYYLHFLLTSCIHVSYYQVLTSINQNGIHAKRTSAAHSKHIMRLSTAVA